MTVRRALCVSGAALVAGLAVLAYPLAAVSGSAQRNGPLYAAKLNLAGGDNPDSWCLWIRPLTGALTRVGDGCPATAPLVSPDGHWIVYVEPLQGIIVRSLHGTPPRIGPARVISLESPPLAPFTYHYGWSPDSKRIAVMSSDGGDAALLIVRRDGSRLRRITCSCPGPLTHLAWARRGPLAYTDAHRLYTVDPAGGKARRRAGAARCTYSAATPTVSPNGRTALFVCGRRIVAVDLKRSTRRTFFNAARLPRACRSTSPTPFAALAWSPDAQSIAVASPCGIVVMRADGSRVRQLPETFELEFDTELRWAAARSG